MTRLRRFYRAHREAITWIAVVLVLVATFVLGVIGFQKNLVATDHERHYSISTRAFLVLQMLILNSGALPEPIPWELETARVLAVLVFFGTIMKAVVVLFREQLNVLRIRWLAKHVIICGADGTGSRLATDLLAENEHVVVIERDADRNLDDLRELGAFVLNGDAAHVPMLESAGVTLARRVMIACGDDATNIQIAAAAGDLCRERTGSEPIVIHVHCVDSRLFGLLEPSPDTASRVEFRRFDTVSNGVRLLVEDHPLDYLPIAPDSTRVVQLVLLGYSRESECLLLQLARLGHYANLRHPRVRVVAPDAVACEHGLRFRFPQIDNILQLEFVARNIDHIDTMADISRWLEDDDAISTLVVSPRNEDDSLPFAFGLPTEVAECNVPVFVRLSHHKDLAGLLTRGGHRPRLLAFGSLEWASSAAMVIQAELDRLAQAWHADYVRRREAQGKKSNEYPAMRPWYDLSEAFREANRQQADHISVKLRAVNCEPVQFTDARPPAMWTDTETEMLSRMEHQRWNANRWLDGWRIGPRNDAKKSHPMLVPWEELDEATRSYDRDAVRQIPELLAGINIKVVRMVNTEA